MKFLITLLEKTEGLIRRVKKSLQKKDPQTKELERWYSEDPHHLKRSDFEFLNDKSVVFDLGGYEGQWSSDIFSRYNCEIHVFEPVSVYADLIRKRFSKNKKIHTYQLGLAHKNYTATITIQEFASRISDGKETGVETETIELKDFLDFITEKNIESIDLLKVNIEGAEFPLLEHLIHSGAISKVKNLLIQFHNFVPDAIQKRADLQRKLNNTHQNIFDYYFVWEHWQIKE